MAMYSYGRYMHTDNVYYMWYFTTCGAIYYKVQQLKWENHFILCVLEGFCLCNCVLEIKGRPYLYVLYGNLV